MSGEVRQGGEPHITQYSSTVNSTNAATGTARKETNFEDAWRQGMRQGTGMPPTQQVTSQQITKPGNDWQQNVAQKFDEMHESFQDNKKQAIGGGILTACTFPLAVIGGAIGGLIGFAKGLKAAIKQDNKASKTAEKNAENPSGPVSGAEKNDLYNTLVGKKEKPSFFERHGQTISKFAEDGAKIGATVGSLGGFYLLHEALFGNKMETLS